MLTFYRNLQTTHHLLLLLFLHIFQASFELSMYVQ
nr:MAG TPA: hypothetical protein [Caudoviricetes sp.]